MTRPVITLVAVAVALVAAPPSPIAGQGLLDRPPNLHGPTVGVPWILEIQLPHRFSDGNPTGALDLTSTTTFTGALGLPWRALAGVAYAIESPTVPGEPDELQPFARYQLTPEGEGWVDEAITLAWNHAAGSIDVEGTLARQLGPLRVLAAARWFSDHRGTGDSHASFAAGGVWYPWPRSAPISFAADAALPRTEGGEVPWSAGVQVGIPHTALTLSLHATNTAAVTLQGVSVGSDRVRFGFEATAPIPLGFFFGGYPPRSAAQEAVVAEPAGGAPDAVVEIRRYAYGPARVVVRAGSVVEWVNRDEVVHTATAEDGAWDSEGILPGRSWSARFDEPGTYPYYCGPHPFMKGVVIVR